MAKHKQFQCNWCERSFSTPNLLSRHKNKDHKNLLNDTSKKSIMKSIVNNENLPQALRKAANYLEKGGTIPSLPQEIVTQITEEEAKAQFVLRALNIARVFRAWKLMQIQDKLDALLEIKVNSKEFEKLPPEEVQNISIGVQGSLNREVAIVNEEKKSWQNTISDLLKQIGMTIAPASAKGTNTLGDSDSRAKILGIVGLLLEGGKNGHRKAVEGNQPITIRAEEVTDSDMEGDEG